MRVLGPEPLGTNVGCGVCLTASLFVNGLPMCQEQCLTEQSLHDGVHVVAAGKRMRYR